jgi:hypothetical protein
MSAVHTQIATAVQSTIRGLALTGIPSSQVYLREVATDRGATPVELPAVIVSKGQDPETQPDGTNRSDDWGYPCLVTIMEAANQDTTWNDRRSIWREAIRTAFHHKRLAGVTLVYTCQVEPRTIIDTSLFRTNNVAFGQLLVRALTREQR